MSFGIHNASYKALAESTICQSGQIRRCSCGSPCRPHAFFCGDECRFWAKVKKGPGCWEWTGSRSGGRRGHQDYGQFTIACADGIRRARGAHVYSYELINGPVPEGLELMHLCHNTKCVRPDHLSPGTHTENVQASAALGKLNTARPRKQKLTAEDIHTIRARVQAGELRSHVARTFGVSTTYVMRLVTGEARQYDAPLQRSIEKAS
jgi:hypothetical protein